MPAAICGGSGPVQSHSTRGGVRAASACWKTDTCHCIWAKHARGIAPTLEQAGWNRQGLLKDLSKENALALAIREHCFTFVNFDPRSASASLGVKKSPRRPWRLTAAGRGASPPPSCSRVRRARGRNRPRPSSRWRVPMAMPGLTCNGPGRARGASGDCQVDGPRAGTFPKGPPMARAAHGFITCLHRRLHFGACIVTKIIYNA